MPLFKKKQIQKTHNFTPTVPSGLIAKTEKGSFYVKGAKRFKFVSDRAKDSWGIKEVITSEAAMINIKVTGLLGFRDGTLIKDISDGKIYLVSDNKRRHIINPDVLIWLGNNSEDGIVAGQKEISIHPEGEKLDG